MLIHYARRGGPVRKKTRKLLRGPDALEDNSDHQSKQQSVKTIN